MTSKFSPNELTKSVCVLIHQNTRDIPNDKYIQILKEIHHQMEIMIEDIEYSGESNE